MWKNNMVRNVSLMIQYWEIWGLFRNKLGISYSDFCLLSNYSHSAILNLNSTLVITSHSSIYTQHWIVTMALLWYLIFQYKAALLLLLFFSWMKLYWEPFISNHSHGIFQIYSHERCMLKCEEVHKSSTDKHTQHWIWLQCTNLH